MINEDKVKELFYVARYDSEEDRFQKQMSSYYGWDFIWKEVLKSFFTGTLAFTGLTVLAVFTNAKQLLADINKIDFQSTGVMLGLIYIAFMLAYIMITIIVYAVRYKTGRKKARQYMEHLKRVGKMYEREEKLKR
ncbi:hypothetical protein [Agathobacter sp.]|uniref:hypothetical protein n=1 Tax=Agathobacter sp. TaxID=2021311 RepID=UPI003AB1F31D